MSEFQQKIIEDELKNEIFNEKCRMIEDTETLSELSRTIDEMGNTKINGTTSNNFNTSSITRVRKIDTNMELNDNQISKIDDTFGEFKPNSYVDESKDLLDNTSILEKGKQDYITGNLDKSLNKSGFEMLSPKIDGGRSRSQTPDHDN